MNDARLLLYTQPRYFVTRLNSQSQYSSSPSFLRSIFHIIILMFGAIGKEGYTPPKNIDTKAPSNHPVCQKQKTDVQFQQFQDSSLSFLRCCLLLLCTCVTP